MTLSETLGLLNLGSNKLTSPIANTFPTSCALQTVDLSRNQLDGPLPKSLAYCMTLEVLDLGRNQITSGFPCLLNNISTLRVLVCGTINSIVLLDVKRPMVFGSCFRLLIWPLTTFMVNCLENG